MTAVQRCSGCGQTISGTERFCPTCGQQLQRYQDHLSPAINTTIPLVPAHNSRLAIASLICGVMTWILFFIPLLLAIPAVICGHLGHSAVKRGNGAVTGRGIALIGMALGYAHLVLTVLVFCVFVAIVLGTNL